ncbi:phosphopyruvate hydratase [Variovorax sp. Sphag1AA]|uniref:phosphopyruvate hydratase n=1 Tax=Variovorax sp. Sphag1AA TaxID=2587027 RepID=UPI003907F179
MDCIGSIRAMEILDSRGNPTVRVSVVLDSGARGTSSVPAGASIGVNEAAELRDGDMFRYRGRGVRKAVGNVNDVLAPALMGMDVTRQVEIDDAMREIDGTANLERMGANAVLAVSQACAVAAAASNGVPLYTYLGGKDAVRLPMPMINVINGGKHADSSLDMQEFMIVPIGAPSFSEALRYGVEIFHALARILGTRGYTSAVGDEGGFAPLLTSNEEAFDLIMEAIVAAGYRPGVDICLALDAAAASFFRDGNYWLSRTGYRSKTSVQLIELYQQWVHKYPIVSIEDGIAESDPAGLRELMTALGHQIQIMGDDLVVTNPEFIARAIEQGSCNAALIKLNQIGTVSAAIAAVELCCRAHWHYAVAHRSGETEDTFIADFAVAMNASHIKTGSVCRGERTAKYNRLLEIEGELGARALFGHDARSR